MKPILSNEEIQAICNPVRTYVSGVYRVTGQKLSLTSGGVPYIRFVLSSSEGDINAVLWPKRLPVPEDLFYLSLVSIHGCYMNSETKGVVILETFERVGRAHLFKTPILYSLPRKFNNSTAFDQLLDGVRGLTSDILQGFVRRVLERRDIVEPFLKNPASKRYHHNVSGGLLEHSVTVANNVVKLIEMNEPSMPIFYRELGYVAGLLHDIGKARMYNRNAPAHLVGHDSLTLEICAPALAYLDTVNSDAANTLRHIWTKYHSSYSPKTVVTLARYVRDADGMNAIAANTVKAFSSQCQHGAARLGNGHYWRPKALTGSCR